MKESEKMYLLDKCKKHYIRAIEISKIHPWQCFEELGKARGIKEIIEDCIGEEIQLTKYYKKYQTIVELENKF